MVDIVLSEKGSRENCKLIHYKLAKNASIRRGWYNSYVSTSARLCIVYFCSGLKGKHILVNRLLETGLVSHQFQEIEHNNKNLFRYRDFYRRNM